MQPESLRDAIAGATCSRLVVQEAWYRGELVEPANLLFLQVDGSRWIRCFIDAGFFGWRAAEAPVQISAAEAAPEFEYPLVDLTARLRAIGSQVRDVTLTERPLSGADLEICFDGGGVLRLRNADDVTRLEFSPPAG